MCLNPALMLQVSAGRNAECSLVQLDRGFGLFPANNGINEQTMNNQ